MDIENPTSGRGTPSLSPLAPRVDGLDGKHVGLYDNGKVAAEPVLAVLKGKLAEAYDDVTFEEFSLEAKHQIQDPGNRAAVEEAGVASAGLVDESSVRSAAMSAEEGVLHG